MTNIRRQISIACSPERVFAVGDHFNQVVKVLHVELDTEWEVTDLVENETIRVEGRSKANGSASVTQRVAPHEHDAEQILAALKALCEGVAAR